MAFHRSAGLSRVGNLLWEVFAGAGECHGRVEKPRLAVDITVVGHSFFWWLGPERVERLTRPAATRLVDHRDAGDVKRFSFSASRIEPIEQPTGMNHIDEDNHVSPPKFIGIAPEFWREEVVG